MSSTVQDGTVVSIHYTLKNDAGEVLDSSAGEEPLGYLHGAHNLVPGLEREITGRAVGDALDVVVAPEDAYGERADIPPAHAPLDAFPEGVELEVGMPLILEDDDGNEHPVWIVAMDDTSVVLDQNHPLSGETLHFSVEIVGIREATDEEKAHGHAHGPEGHAH